MLSEFHGQRVSAIQIDYAPVLPMSKLHECEVNSVWLDIDVCMDEAWSRLRTIQQMYNDFLETKEPSVFSANAKSRLCGEKYCDAFDTGWCKVGACN